MILYTAGQTEGRHQDNWLLHESGLSTWMLGEVSDLCGSQFCVYGDPIFARSREFQKGFPRVGRTHMQEAFNRAMNAARVSIEHVFGRVVSLWAFVDFAKQMKLRATRSHLVSQGTVMTNCHACMYGNKVSKYFDVEPPDIYEYIAMCPP
jgi:hypothetical protein